ncbi:tripartite tricarboxylate transporter TctB family protein [Alloalcanivorax mobilis]|uniref:tripartite tricarboxylate transporter TctB family protein n=1 Tax=Alloalcanivorax mobilis TaxID=2019569 RepID=UPI000B5B4750|nr:tripartite tricarboxylate transporter TctB family protein [Alloalcanivorax mobilis]ASK33869.1 tripartite tricarboxylate transporter small permease [Alcanivorax sp. N3-2A]|tara:strand:- start:43830 stop:44339 length:510 start_codon:yes stop_codon:yes gene_type:complete
MSSPHPSSGANGAASAPPRQTPVTASLNRGEIVVAVCFFLLGGALIAIASGYSIGSLRRMGPGYFPLVLGGLLCAVAVALLVEVLRSRNPAPPLPWRPFTMVSLGILCFAFLIERLGMVPAVIALVILSALGDRTLGPLAIGAIALVMSVVSVLLFITALGIPLAAFKG